MTHVKNKRRDLPAAEYLRLCLSYDKRTGSLLWKKRPREHFLDQRSHNTWNARYAGREAFTTQAASGHFTGRLDDQLYLKHRVIWKLVTGDEPPVIVDHKDRDPSNNKWKNFRSASKSQNNMNSDRLRGVRFDANRGKWHARIQKDGRQIFLGRFDTESAARLARQSAELKFYGEFAPCA